MAKTIFETDRTYLRSFIEDDLESLMPLMSDMEVMAKTGFKEPKSRTETQKLLRKWTQCEGTWAACSKEEDELIGWFMLKDTGLDAPEIGFMIKRSLWGQGLASEIAQALIEWAQSKEGIYQVFARVNPQNLNSQKVLEKIGMRQCSDHNLADENTIIFKISTSYH